MHLYKRFSVVGKKECELAKLGFHLTCIIFNWGGEQNDKNIYAKYVYSMQGKEV